MKKNIIFLVVGLVAFFTKVDASSPSVPQNNPSLKFNPNMEVTENTITLPDGKTVKYRAYENIFYVTNVVDPTYQSLNIYVPESVYANNKKAPVFLKTNVGGYMASKASAPSDKDATGRALQEGYVVVIPGSRGSNSMIKDVDGTTVYTGRAPAGLVDLKAAVRYIRHNKDVLPVNTDYIITNGTSAGGAMSALLGATGNHPGYEPYLQALGAAKEKDDIFAAVCFCPITDLEHADMIYEWLYHDTNKQSRKLSKDQIAISEELAAMYPAYLKSLELKMPDGTLLDNSNYENYLNTFIIQSAQKAKNAGIDIPESTGIIMSEDGKVLDVDLDEYLGYVVSKKALKTPPAFDQMGVLGGKASPENNVFGDLAGNGMNFTNYSMQKATKNSSVEIDPVLREKRYLMNPMNFIENSNSTTAPNWYIRHGAIDRDTGFPVPINLYTKLINSGYNADFELAWDRGHSGDYDLDEMFEWINNQVNK